MEKLVHDNPAYKGKGKLTESMRNRLTKAARCAIISCSNESNRCEAIIKLEKDLLNSPLHCFGYHSKCSVDFCTTEKELAHTPSSSGDDSNSSGDYSNSSGGNDMMDTSSEGYNSSNALADTSIDQQDDLEDAAMELQQEWNDATDDTSSENCPCCYYYNSHCPRGSYNLRCTENIRGRLVGKASQLLGIPVENNVMIYTLLYRKLYDQLG